MSITVCSLCALFICALSALSFFLLRCTCENFFVRNTSNAKPGEVPPKVLLISYDAFRWDYVNLYNSYIPNIRWLIEHGVHATEGLKNTFITITAPNHFAIVTGLYEETHQVVANYFYDPDIKKTCDYFNPTTGGNNTDPRFFQYGYPLWLVNDNETLNRRTGCMMWVGCDVPIQGRHPSFWQGYEDGAHYAWESRVDQLISWFTDPIAPINFGLLYIEEPDETGHAYGPFSTPTAKMVGQIDKLTGYLLWSLFRADLLGQVNLIFTADHGMAAVPSENVVYLNDYVNSSWYSYWGGSPNLNVLPKPGMEELVYEALKIAPHMRVFKKQDVPLDYHYRSSDRILPLQFVADVDWRLSLDTAAVERASGVRVRQQRGSRRQIVRPLSKFSIVGEHGYNNSLSDMHPYFVGYGPAFKSGFNVTQFFNIDLFPLMAYMLGLRQQDLPPINGSFDRVKALLKDEGLRWHSLQQFGRRHQIASTPAVSSLTSLNVDLFWMCLCLLLWFASMAAMLSWQNRAHHRLVC